MSQRLRELAFLNKGLKITIKDERADKEHTFHDSEGGIKALVEYLTKNKTPLHQSHHLFEGEQTASRSRSRSSTTTATSRTSSSPTTSTRTRAART